MPLNAGARIIALLLDTLMALLGALSAWIIVTGGSVIFVRGQRISLTGVDNPLLGLTVLLVMRWAAFRSIPWLGVSRWTPVDTEIRAQHVVTRMAARISALTDTGAARLVVCGLVAATVVKLLLAWANPGFFSGDDVEVQEMSIGAVAGENWPIWDLRSAFYPMTFLYPIQAAAAAAGIVNHQVLVALGRSVVACLSTLSVFFVFDAVRRRQSVPVAVFAAFFTATSHLLVAFGSSELPRPVAATLLSAAFAALVRGTLATTTIAAVCLGTAAVLRFSEIAFLVPAVVQLVVERRPRHAAWLAIAAVGVAAAIQATADQLFWGTPFFSLQRAVDYTLVQGQSSRGFQPFWFYVASIPSWSDVVVVALALWATGRTAWRPALWAWIPALMLSALPHKEPRYFVPIMPFVAMLAATGLWKAMTRLGDAAIPNRTSRPATAMAIVVAIAFSTALAITRFSLPRSNREIGLAKEVAVMPGVSGIGVEQLWRWGARLYLGRIPAIRELDGSLGVSADLQRLAADPALTVVAIRVESCVRLSCDPTLQSAGLAEILPDSAPAAGYRVFVRR